MRQAFFFILVLCALVWTSDGARVQAEKVTMQCTFLNAVSGEPLSGCKVWREEYARSLVDLMAPTEGQLLGITDSRGQVQFERSRGLGLFVVQRPKSTSETPPYRYVMQALKVGRKEDAVPSLELRIPHAGWVSVLDFEGKPAPHAQVRLHGPEGGVQTIRCDEKGQSWFDVHGPNRVLSLDAPLAEAPMTPLPEATHRATLKLPRTGSMNVRLMDGQGRPSRLGDRVALRTVSVDPGEEAPSWTTVEADENGVAHFPYVGFGLPLRVRARWQYAKGTDDPYAAMLDDDRIVRTLGVEPLVPGEGARDLHLTRKSRPNEVWIRGRLRNARSSNRLAIRLTHGHKNSGWSTRIAVDAQGDFTASVAMDFARQPTLSIQAKGNDGSAERSQSTWFSFTQEELKQGALDLGVVHMEAQEVPDLRDKR